MSGTDDIVPLLGADDKDIGYRQGTVVSWDMATGANVINIGGTDIPNVPVTSSADTFGFLAGDTVAVLRFKSSYLILGKISSGKSRGTPEMSVPLYPKFVSNRAAGAVGPALLAATVSGTWEGRFKLTHHTHIVFDGFWGAESGSNTATYTAYINGVQIGQWVSTSFNGTTRGPYDISTQTDPLTGVKWLGLNKYLVVELVLTSVGTGNIVHQPLGCYLTIP